MRLRRSPGFPDAFALRRRLHSWWRLRGMRQQLVRVAVAVALVSAGAWGVHLAGAAGPTSPPPPPAPAPAPPSTPTAGSEPAAASGHSCPQAAAGTIIDVNTADVATLDTLPGIGPALAQRIVEFRQQHGPFETLEDLLEVRGIGPKTLERLAGMVEVARSAASAGGPRRREPGSAPVP